MLSAVQNCLPVGLVFSWKSRPVNIHCYLFQLSSDENVKRKVDHSNRDLVADEKDSHPTGLSVLKPKRSTVHVGSVTGQSVVYYTDCLFVMYYTDCLFVCYVSH